MSYHISQSPFQFCFVLLGFVLSLFKIYVFLAPLLFLHFVSLMVRCTLLHVSTVTGKDSLLGPQVLLDCNKHKSNLDLLSFFAHTIICNITECMVNLVLVV